MCPKIKRHFKKQKLSSYSRYTESTSEWTLDYPPLFAWWEFGLSHLAVYFDPQMLEVSNLNYDSAQTVLFQRLSVILADLMLAYGARTCYHGVSQLRGLPKSTTDGGLYTQMLLLTMANAGLIIVDHIHFQYNGFLFGFLLHSVGCMFQEKYLQSGLFFAVLLNLKHIYLYCAPVYFVYLFQVCLLYTSPSPRDGLLSRMPSSA